MASIKTKVSSVELFSNQCQGDYNIILNIASDILSREERFYIFVQGELEKIVRQLNRANVLYDEIDYKVRLYEKRMEQAQEQIRQCEAEIDYIYSHPQTVTTTDSDGNERTEEVIDYAALSAAQGEKAAANSQYNMYSGMHINAQSVRREAGYLVTRFQNTERGIEAISRSVQNDIFEIKKYIRAIEDEKDFNINSLQGAIDRLQSYLASKAIFMPDGSSYREFAIGKLGENVSQENQETFDMQRQDSNTLKEPDSTQKDKSKYRGTSGENIERNLIEYQNSEIYIESLKYAGIYGDAETQKKMVAILKEMIDNSSLAMRVKDDILPIILDDGRFKNFFEVGHTSGAPDRIGRLESSYYLFGTDVGTNDRGFEKFGYLEVAEKPEAHYYPMGQYGSIIVEFKKSSVNATFTCGDSLGFFQNKQNGGISCPINNPSLCSMNKYQMKKLADAVKNGYSIPKSANELSYFLAPNINDHTFFEVQYHGDLCVNDIERIVFVSNYGMPSQSITKRLDDLGIKHDTCYI